MGKDSYRSNIKVRLYEYLKWVTDEAPMVYMKTRLSRYELDLQIGVLYETLLYSYREQRLGEENLSII